MENFRNGREETENEFERIFPVSLTSIEKFHFFDGDDSHPNLIFGRLLFDESIDEHFALLAWKIVTSRQPLITAGPTRLRGKLLWALSANFDSAVDTNETFQFQRLEKAPDRWSIPARIDPSVNPGPFLMIRVWHAARDPSAVVRSRQNELAEIWFWAHHTLCDGAAAVVFINDWLQVYRNLVNNVDDRRSVSKIDPRLLTQRNDLGIWRWDFIKHLPHQVVGLFGAAKFLFRNTATILGVTNPQRTVREKRFPALVGDRLAEDVLNHLLAEADRLDVSLNSILLCDLFRSIHEWTISRPNDFSGRQWLRIILPMNIRELRHRELPMANRTSIVQIDRREFESTTRDDQILSIDREIKIIRGWKLDKMFLIVVRIMSLFESNLRRAAQNRKSRGIAVFTNLGRPLRKIPDHSGAETSESLSKLLEFDFVGPIRHGTPFNFSVGKFRRGLRITLHYDATIFSADEASELLQRYAQELRTHPRDKPRH